MEIRSRNVGLVLEGGAMRGMYSAGIVDVFIENNIMFDGVIGVSAGAAVGINYPSKQAGRFLDYNLRFINDKRYMGLGSLIKTGNLMNKEFAYYTVPYVYSPFDTETYLNSGITFYTCATNLETGNADYFQIEEFELGMEIIRATTSMPFVSKPVILNGTPYLDGGVADSIPYQHMFDLGYKKLIVVLTRDAEYRKKPMPALPVKIKYGKYPAFEQRLLERHNEYNESVAKLDQLEQDGKVLVIKPSSPLGIHRTERNLEKIKQVYNRGVNQANDSLDMIREYTSSGIS